MAAEETSRQRQGQRMAALCLGLLIGAVGSMTPPIADARSGPKNAEDLLIVDCLLPGQVRKLGAAATFMSARRPIRTTQADCEIRGGEYVSYDRANYQTALQVWMSQALAGDADAQNYVGEIYLKGLGTPPDFGMAAQWFQKSADQGNKRALTNLAYLYEEGLGVAKDELKALNLYRQASGANGDELLFASEVKVQLAAKDVEIGSLKQTVAEQQEQAETLRSQVRDLQGQLQSRRRSLDSAQAELQGLRDQLAETRRNVGVDLSALDQQKVQMDTREAGLVELARQLEAEKLAVERRKEQLAEQQAALQARRSQLAQSGASAGEDAAVSTLESQADRLNRSLQDALGRAEKLQTQLAQSQALLDKERDSYLARISDLESQAEGRKKDDWELMKLLEGQLAERESQLRDQRMQIVQLEQQVNRGGGALLAAVPTLEIIDPPLVATRGRPAATLRSGPGRQSVVGRVSAPQAIQTITVNGTPVILGDNGLFRASVDVAAGGSNIEVAAVSKMGDAASLEFTLLPNPGASASSSSHGGSDASSGLPSGVRLGTFHALVIGNNDYQSGGFAKLQSAVNDATAVSKVLKERYGYQTRLLLNATRFDILSALNDLRESLKPDDNLLVYYAGHGDLSDDGKQGYWVPVDGQAKVPATWISNAAVSDILDTMEAKHVLVVADSCYAGALAGGSLPVYDASSSKRWGDWVKTMLDGRARIALTSGGVQPVPDLGSGKHSYFTRALLNVLEDNNRLLEGQRLYREVAASLALSSFDAPITQVPQYAPIQFAGHESGEFFFMPRGAGRAP
ncbi:caspase family protein [Pseudomarimonas arenosa]|uniref:Caspase family protein n=1 Tax=Pseudomarimonas arenosa TaxID=2774145 RepID=A0AAW3ZJ75_9GAMM|nr:caspase family protein [Pseudomarimonas arenosa]MBD8526036.1 caspase family protein [Pseudomarimonas arenosa]